MNRNKAVAVFTAFVSKDFTWHQYPRLELSSLPRYLMFGLNWDGMFLIWKVDLIYPLFVITWWLPFYSLIGTALGRLTLTFRLGFVASLSNMVSHSVVTIARSLEKATRWMIVMPLLLPGKYVGSIHHTECSIINTLVQTSHMIGLIWSSGFQYKIGYTSVGRNIIVWEILDKIV